MDERSKLVAYKVIAMMYFMTILSMQGVIMYKQFALGQSIHDFEGFAVIFLVNVLFLLAALLYFGAIPLRKLNLKSIALIYGLFVVLGLLFTFLKYNVFQKMGLSFIEIMDKIIIVVVLCSLILLFFAVFALLGKRKMNKELENKRYIIDFKLLSS
jgi:hypothetical protein